MTLKDTIENDAGAVFCNVSDFAEAVTYNPHRFFGEEERESRSINAIVIREQITSFSEDGGEVALPVWNVSVANSSTLGIASDELDLGGDSITFPARVGEAAQVKSIVKLLSHDEGMLELECR